MSKIQTELDTAFVEALKEYDEQLANDNLGIISGVSFRSNSGRKTNIFVTLIGFIVGIFTGFGFYRTSESEEGYLVITQDGAHFVKTVTEKTKEDGKQVEKHVIEYDIFLPYSKMRKAVRGRNIVFVKELRLVGRVSDQEHSETGYRVDIMLFSETREQVEILKEQLESQDVPIKKGRGFFMMALLIVGILGGVFVGIIMPRMLNTYRAMDTAAFRREINTPTGTASGRYQDRTTSFSARIATNVFTITFENGDSADFVGAVMAGNDRLFLLELSDANTDLRIGEVYRITAVGAGAITTRPQPEESTFERFTRALGVAFGDPRITGVVVDISAAGILSHANYLHMRVVEFEAIEVVVVADSDTYVSAGGNFQLTFVDAYHSTQGVGQRRTDIIVVYFDYYALAAHSASRPFRRFVIYQGDDALELWDGGLRAGDRGFLSTQRLASGEIFHAKAAVIPVGRPDTIRIVAYNADFEIIFTHEMTVRDAD